MIDIKLKTIGIDNYLKVRLNIERELCNPYANIDEIYEFIAFSHPYISNEIINLMKQVEILTEIQMNHSRLSAKSLYQFAINKGKKIICISDMYLSKKIIKCILDKNAYNEIENIYISNELKARKDFNELFHTVLKQEKAKPSEILHIVDDIYSDYYIPQKNGIVSVWMPNAKDKFLSLSNLSKNCWMDSQHLAIRFIEGYTRENINDSYLEIPINYIKPTDKFFQNFDQFLTLALSPFILGISLSILTNSNIQKHYKKIYFASRDGYLPKIVYDILASSYGGLPSEYIYAGRRAYSYILYETIYDYIFSFNNNVKLYNILCNLIFNKDILNIIHKNRQKLNIPLFEKSDVFKTLLPYNNILNIYYSQMRQNAYNYYFSHISNNPREIIFDCGYSGSISKAFSIAMKKPVDKIYLYETDENRNEDKINNTKTFTLLDGENIPPRGINLLYEELFSPLEGSCIGFDNIGNPILDNEVFSEQMISKYKHIKSTISNYASSFIKLNKENIKYFEFFDIADLQKPVISSIYSSNNSTLELFDDIIFKDLTEIAPDMTLSEKLSLHLPYKDSFDGTNYLRENLTLPAKIYKQSISIGIHIHLFHLYTVQQFLQQLYFFPLKFDLYITYPEGSDEHLFPSYFNHSTLSNLNLFKTIPVKNRGRDIAPWIISMRGIQENYDIFCHIQSKASFYSNIGGHWRCSSVDNLINYDNFINIYRLFESHQNLGCVIPRAYIHTVNHIKNDKVDLMGMFGEFEVM